MYPLCGAIALALSQPVRANSNRGKQKRNASRQEPFACAGAAQSIETQAATVKKLIKIEDLQDPKKVEKIIQKQDAASKVSVDLATGRVEAETSADPAAIAAALTAAGFPAKQAAA